MTAFDPRYFGRGDRIWGEVLDDATSPALAAHIRVVCQDAFDRLREDLAKSVFNYAGTSTNAASASDGLTIEGDCVEVFDLVPRLEGPR